MRIVALEEHFTVPAMAARIDGEAMRARGLTPGGRIAPAIDRREQLREVGSARLADMDAAGISVQVLSATGVGAELLPASEGPTYAREMNDHLARLVADNPDRFAGFTHLPMSAPEAAADELERCVTGHGLVGGMVHGTTGGLFLDDPCFAPLLSRFETLGAPLYLHPAVPPEAVRRAYYDRLPGMPAS